MNLYKKNKQLLLFFLSFFFISCSNEVSQDWIYPFQKDQIKYWRGYNQDIFPATWYLNDEVMSFRPKIDKMSGDDIVFTFAEFENFELYIEWKIYKGGNSGILYHVKEDKDFPAHLVGQEYQIIDDKDYLKMNFGENLKPWYDYMNKIELYPTDELHELQKTGALYAMYPAKNKNLNHVGDWNSSRIIITNEKAKFYLNGEEVLSFIPWSNDWDDKISQTKNFLGTPFGSVKSGYICLQEHGSPVFFRNMKIRKL